MITKRVYTTYRNHARCQRRLRSWSHRVFIYSYLKWVLTPVDVELPLLRLCLLIAQKVGVYVFISVSSMFIQQLQYPKITRPTNKNVHSHSL